MFKIIQIVPFELIHKLLTGGQFLTTKELTTARPTDDSSNKITHLNIDIHVILYKI